jgi:hypothetical protein
MLLHRIGLLIFRQLLNTLLLAFFTTYGFLLNVLTFSKLVHLESDGLFYFL